VVSGGVWGVYVCQTWLKLSNECKPLGVGGVYVDLDMESLRPMDPLLEGYTCLLGQEPAAGAYPCPGFSSRPEPILTQITP